MQHERKIETILQIVDNLKNRINSNDSKENILFNFDIMQDILLEMKTKYQQDIIELRKTNFVTKLSFRKDSVNDKIYDNFILPRNVITNEINDITEAEMKLIIHETEYQEFITIPIEQNKRNKLYKMIHTKNPNVLKFINIRRALIPFGLEKDINLKSKISINDRTPFSLTWLHDALNEIKQCEDENQSIVFQIISLE